MIEQWIFVAAMLFAALLGSLGQIAMKKASSIPLHLMLFSWYAWAFAAMYGVAVLINLWAYKSGGKVSVLYPVIATSYIWTMLLAAVYLGEEFTMAKIIGSVVIVVGVAIVVW